MKIIYDANQEVYIVKLEYPDTITLFKTNDIVEVRKEFINCMTNLFNDEVNKQLTDTSLKGVCPYTDCGTGERECEGHEIDVFGSRVVLKKEN